jgi:hypothetical protein
MWVAPKCHFSQDSQVESFENFKIGTLTILEAHNFLCTAPMEVRYKEKMYPLLKVFQRYVARHLHASKSKRFPTFSDRESN